MSRRDAVGIAKQSAFGTKTTTMAFWPPVMSEDIAIERETIEAEETLGTRGRSDIVLGGKVYKGGIKGLVRPSSFPMFLSALMGPATSASLGGSPTAYSHTFDPIAATAPRYLSVLTHNADITPAVTDLYYDGVCTEMGVSVEANGYMEFDSKWVFANLDESQSSPTVTRETLAGFTFKDITAQLSVNGGALAPIKLKSFDITFKQETTDDDFVLGSTAVASLPVGNFDADVKFVTTDTISTHYRRMLAASDYVRVKLTAEGATISGANKYTVEFDFPFVRYTDAPVDIDAGDTLSTVEITGMAIVDPSTSKLVTAKVINDTIGTTY